MHAILNCCHHAGCGLGGPTARWDARQRTVVSPAADTVVRSSPRRGSSPSWTPPKPAAPPFTAPAAAPLAAVQPTASAIAGQLPAPASAGFYQNKIAMLEAFLQEGIPVPRFRIVVREELARRRWW